MYKAVFSSPEGKAVLNDLILSTSVLGSSYLAGDVGGLSMAYNEGARSIVTRIISQIIADPEQYIKIIEHASDSAQEDII